MAQDEFAKLMALSAGKSPPSDGDAAPAAEHASAADSLSIDPLAAMTRRSTGDSVKAAAANATAASNAQPAMPPMPLVPAAPAGLSAAIASTPSSGAMPNPASAANKPAVTALDKAPPTPVSAAPSASGLGVKDGPSGPSASITGNLALSAPSPDAETDTDPQNGTIEPPPRRISRRRPAGPVRGKIAANDDVPSIGGLIYALEQKPSVRVFRMAGIASAIWAIIGITFATLTLAPKLSEDVSIAALLLDPVAFYTAAAVLVPIAIFWLLALLNWHIASLSLKSSTMTEVAIRLAEPDRNAEQSIASLGQAVRRQVSFMNDAVSRALGRAGELEALVHNQVAELERSYEQNEQRIRGLIQELTGERHALLNTSNGVTDTLKTLGTEIPALIEKLSTQQTTLAGIIKGAGENLATLEGSLAESTGRFETVLGDRTLQLQTVLEDYTSAFSSALESRTEHMRTAFDQYMLTLDTTLGNRTGDLQTVFEEYARALDTTLGNRADALDAQLVERTQSLDDAFQRRLELFEQQISNSTAVIDNAVSEKANLLTSALEAHAISFRETMERQAVDLDESVMTGINAVRRSSENITLQTMRAIEGLSQQSSALQHVSDNLFQRIEAVTNRFENQSSQVLKAASQLEDTNSRIDTTLQSRHEQLARTLDRLSGKADEFGRTIADYSTGIEGSLTSMEEKARLLTHELRDGAENRSRELIAELERLKSETEAEGQRKIDELRYRFTNVSSDLSKEFGSLTTQLKSASDETRRRAAEAAEELAREQARIRDEAARLPSSTRETAEAMRRALQDQMRALDQLSQLSNRAHSSRDIIAPTRQSERIGQTSATPATAASSALRTGTAGRDRWSLGDLLARASTDEHQDTAPPQTEEPRAKPASPVQRPEASVASSTTASGSFRLDIATVARAIDPATASNLWGRLRVGQQGVMVRSLYPPDARRAFDDIQQRLPVDSQLRQTVSRYISDFERILNEADAQDPSGQLAHSNIVSETGRVYLFLAHASGRFG